MVFCPIYLIAMAFAAVNRKWFNASILLIGACISCVHYILMRELVGIETLPWLVIMFLLSSVWFHLLDSMKARCSSILAAALCLFLAVGIIDAASYPNTTTVYYASYPIIITVFNLAMIYFGATDNGNCCFGGADSDLLRKNNKKSEADL